MTRARYEKPTFSHVFLDSDTITVRNKLGVAITFSIQTDIPIERHDQMLRSVLVDGWGKMQLVLHEPYSAHDVAHEPANRRDNVVDGGYDAKLIKQWFGIEWHEFQLMYNHARLQIVTAIEERLSALTK